MTILKAIFITDGESFFASDRTSFPIPFLDRGDTSRAVFERMTAEFAPLSGRWQTLA